eukprot:CAMPEP_0113667418 /NCGR_PEP_ID=MMETSP0038_2-20120614/3425_1 /TAXON_ID=2898 /ORGANISM="Cryptomonas paramecium" /LENGTH=140 /DNA_ID=CAMNT_0000583031 /DNA_START=90 /DNA_END=509 /DNA_ORIENTATION=+ /assembly_acc=CAM_ASM_000170
MMRLLVLAELICLCGWATALFDVKSISQSSPIVNAQNTITVTLQASVTITTAITITGLGGANASTALSLQSVSGGNSGNDLFIYNSVRSTAQFDSGTIYFTIANDRSMAQNVAYAFSFILTNPSAPIAAPSISVESGGTS